MAWHFIDCNLQKGWHISLSLILCANWKAVEPGMRLAVAFLYPKKPSPKSSSTAG
jgi:hypothetical protein